MKFLFTLIKRGQNSLVAAALLGITIAVIRLYPHPPLSEPLSFSTTYYDQNQLLLRITLANDDRYRLWTPLADISPDIINGLLLHEDQWFYYHPGVNPSSLIRAFWATYIGGGNRQGASTITMQLARMYWQLNTKTITGKLLQMVKAFQLELMYSKDEILEAYLNYAPFGRNIESIGAASLIYFDKRPADVNLPEALTLTVLPQSPTYRIDKKNGIAGAALVTARNKLFKRWTQHYQIDETISALFKQPLVMRQPEQLPFIAPHFINQIIQQNSQQNITPNITLNQVSLPYLSGSNLNQSITTTLDNQLQKIIEQQITAFVERNAIKGIHNASVILVDTQTMGVKALVGSADYFNESIHGQVNGTLAKRSPGSTLKPFIYGLGFDQGILHPMTILKDVETDFGFYTPENFDRHFKGPISATDALIHSRNIPAVYVASKLKNPSFYDFLQQANITDLASEAHYGLALVLGGGEVTSQELASLYAILANQGQWQPLQFIHQPPQTHLDRTLLSPEASFMTRDMLLQNIRKQDILYNKQRATSSIYWKTGTSWGFRDAWTAGGFGQYVMVVWLGNFDGRSNSAFVGADAATPLFFNIVDAINAYYPNVKSPPRHIPNNIKKVDICLTSGNLVTAWCQVKGKTWFIPGVSPITVDTVFRPVIVDNHSGQAVCPPYNPQTSHVEVFEYWPSDLNNVFAQAGIAKKSPPDNSHCASLNMSFGERPKITSPLKNVVYQFNRNNLNNERISLIANADGEVRHLYWFVGNQFLGQSQINNAIDWVPNQSGNYKILVVDDYGRSDFRTVTVELIH